MQQPTIVKRGKGGRWLATRAPEESIRWLAAKVANNKTINYHTVAEDGSGEGQSTQTTTNHQQEQYQWAVAGNNTVCGQRSMIGGEGGQQQERWQRQWSTMGALGFDGGDGQQQQRWLWRMTIVFVMVMAMENGKVVVTRWVTMMMFGSGRAAAGSNSAMDNGNGGSHGQQQWQQQWTMKMALDDGSSQWAFLAALARQQRLILTLYGGGSGSGGGGGKWQWWGGTEAMAAKMSLTAGSSWRSLTGVLNSSGSGSGGGSGGGGGDGWWQGSIEATTEKIHSTAAVSVGDNWHWHLMEV
jgi:hypothetical protein